jgi:hypothetical protein
MMRDDLNIETGTCAQCGQPNQRHWVYCDHCGARLPWAPPQQVKDLNDLSDEQLATLFALAHSGSTPAWVRFLKTWPGKVTLGLIASLLWELLNRLFFHFY